MSLFIFRGEDKYSSELQSDEEDLEPPLPLRSDDEWQHYSHFVPPQCCMKPCGKEIFEGLIFLFHRIDHK